MLFTDIKFHWLRLVIVVVVWPACRKETIIEREIKAEMLAAVNTIRQAGCTCGVTYMPPVKPVAWNDTLAAAALAHARDMDAGNYLNHISPAGTSPIQRAIVLGYTGNYVTENIARGFTSLDAVMESWLKSDVHCKALMDSGHTHVGAANVNSYWAQEFGSHR